MDKHNKEVIKRSEEDQKRSTELSDSSYRDEFYKRQLHNDAVYNKAIIYLSSIGLVVISSILVRFVFHGFYQEDDLFLLVSAWILFSLSISCTVFSFLMNNKAIEVQLENAKQYCIDRNPKVFDKPNIWSKINTALNFSSGILFVAALVPAIIFIIFQVSI